MKIQESLWTKKNKIEKFMKNGKIEINDKTIEIKDKKNRKS